MKFMSLTVPMAMLAVTMSGCSSNPKEPSPAAAPQSAAPTASADLSSQGAGDGAASQPRSLATSELQNSRLVYFDFDEAVLKEQFREHIAAHARYLAENPAIRLRLEGHADERGTREYNIALGERRAKAVRRALALEGIQADRLQLVSYGEERPAVVRARSEHSYARNRRVEFNYLNGDMAQAPLSYEEPEIAEESRQLGSRDAGFRSPKP